MSLDAESEVSADAPLDDSASSLSAEMQAELGQQTQGSGEQSAAAEASTDTDFRDLGQQDHVADTNSGLAGAGEAQGQAVASLREQFAAAGIPIQGQDDAQVLAEIQQVYQALPVLRQQAELARQYQAYQAQQQFAAQQQRLAEQQHYQGQQFPGNQPPGARPGSASPQRAGRPEFDPAWVNLVHSVNGEIVAKNPLTCHPDIPAKVKAYQDWEQKTVQSMLENWRSPEEQQAEIEQRVQSIVAQQLQSFQQQQQQTQQISQIEQTLGQHLYKLGADGQPMVNQMTGQRVLSPYGTQYTQVLGELLGGQWEDPNFQDHVTRAILRGMGVNDPLAAPAPQAQATQRQGQQQQLQQQRNNFLGGRLNNGAGRAPNRNGAQLHAARNEEMQNGFDFEKALKADARQAGLYPEKSS